jgi:integrase
MSEPNSNPSVPAAKPTKPSKPYPEFPLTAHPAGYWVKKIRGKLFYFGRWDDPDAALAKYLEQKDALHAGKTPRPDSGALTVKELANHFLNAKLEAVEAGELSPRTFDGYRIIIDSLVAGLGKSRLVGDLDPQDFAALKSRLAKTNGPTRMGVIVQVVRCCFKYAYESGIIDKPMRFGPQFKRTARKVLRLHKAKLGPKLFTAEEIHRLLDAAGVQLRAMFLLGINCGFGNSDCANLPLAVVDFDAAIIDFPRPKTGINRRCPLWPETVQALREAIAKRPEPRQEEAKGLVFVTIRGQPWFKATSDTPISKETKKLLRKLGINGRVGLGFYTLRHVFRTVADEARDQPACDFIMGHADPSMAAHYRERIGDARLKAVTDHVHAWLFGASTDLESKASE